MRSGPRGIGLKEQRTGASRAGVRPGQNGACAAAGARQTKRIKQMMTFQVPTDIALSQRLNSELRPDISATVDRREEGGHTVHGLVLQHGIRQRIIERTQTFSDVDLAGIVQAAAKWADAAVFPLPRALGH
jgi:hypothetical protein